MSVNRNETGTHTRRHDETGWDAADEVRRDMARAMTPAERMVMLEELVDFIFTAWDLNPQLRASGNA